MIRKMFACIAVVCLAAPAYAGWFETLASTTSYVEEIPTPAGVEVENAPSVVVEHAAPVPAPVEVYSPVVPHAHVHCCKKPEVTYMNHPLMALMMHKCKTGQAVKVVLEVPTCCCPVEVPVCVPCQCADCPPKMHKTVGFLGRCVYEYCWPCGTTIRIAQKRNGDLIVHSFEL